MLRDKKASCNYKSCMQFKQTDLGKVPQIHSLAYSHQFLHAQCPLWRQFCFQWSFNFTASRKCNAKKKLSTPGTFQSITQRIQCTCVSLRFPRRSKEKCNMATWNFNTKPWFWQLHTLGIPITHQLSWQLLMKSPDRPIRAGTSWACLDHQSNIEVIHNRFPHGSS